MGLMKKGICSVLVIVIILALIIAILPSYLNRFQKDGLLKLEGLERPVKVLRDEKGMAYIYAENLHDGIMAQGFVTAQDRLFQMELTRLFSTGCISELAGEGGRDLDIRMRTIGIHRNAKKHAKMLDNKNRLFFQKYIDGINAYVRTCTKTHPLEFNLPAFSPKSGPLRIAWLSYITWGGTPPAI